MGRGRFSRKFPNITGDFIAFSSGSKAFYGLAQNVGRTLPSTSPDTPQHNKIAFDASRVSSMYQNNINDVRVNALFGLQLIRAY